MKKEPKTEMEVNEEEVEEEEYEVCFYWQRLYSKLYEKKKRKNSKKNFMKKNFVEIVAFWNFEYELKYTRKSMFLSDTDKMRQNQGAGFGTVWYWVYRLRGFNRWRESSPIVKSNSTDWNYRRQNTTKYWSI